jgi:hypothetical protein
LSHHISTRQLPNTDTELKRLQVSDDAQRASKKVTNEEENPTHQHNRCWLQEKKHLIAQRPPKNLFSLGIRFYANPKGSGEKLQRWVFRRISLS